MNIDFPCIKCGLCCKKVNNVPKMSYLDRGDGICLHLKDNICLIYSDRPFLCNSEKVYSKYFSNMPKEEYYAIILKHCIEIANNFNRDDLVIELKNILKKYDNKFN